MTQPNDNGRKAEQIGQSQIRHSEQESSSGQKTPDQLRDEIARTRSALSGDVAALGEKFSPEHLKENAKEVIHHAKEAATESAKDIIRDAREATIGSLRNAKDHAFDSISETVGEIGRRAQRAGGSAADFVSVNALPLSLIGLGVGWLMLTVGHSRRTARSDYTYEGDLYEGQRGGSLEGARRRTREAVESTRERVNQVASRAGQTIGEAREELRERAGEVRSQIAQRASDARRQAVDLGHEAYDQLSRAGTRVRDFSSESPMAVGLFALALGLGAGLLLPTTRRENRLMGETRDRLLGSARDTVSQLGRSVQQGASELRDAVAEQTRAH
jgi:ElaB/YqjD/DUF883 family membrane-anchored ribosome-binding protein